MRKLPPFSTHPLAVRVDDPVTLQPGTSHAKEYSEVLREDVWVRLYLQDLCPASREYWKEWGISKSAIQATSRYYARRAEYRDRIVAADKARISRRMFGNTNGFKGRPRLLLPRETLEAMLERGMSYHRIAKELGTSEHYVKKNCQHYGLMVHWRTPERVLDADREYLAIVEKLVPGFENAAKNYWEDRGTFFELLYRAHLRVLTLSYFIRKLASSYSYNREAGKAPKSHICFSCNWGEAVLSEALLNLGIPHLRQFFFRGKESVDFVLPDSMVAIEVDGETHYSEEQFGKDLLRDEELERQGYLVLRFSRKQVERELQWVLERIQSTCASRKLSLSS